MTPTGSSNSVEQNVPCTKPKTVLCFSGGLDSTTLLYEVKSRGMEVYCLSVYYGQKHAIELHKAELIAKELGCIWKSVDLASILPLLQDSALTSSNIPVPEGHYSEETMKQTVVPNRNMILLSLATAWAISLKADVVMYACHRGDNQTYPDCRPEFVGKMMSAIMSCDYHKPILITPFLNLTKAEIVKKGAELGVPFEKTYSCYKGNTKHCGKCSTCTARKEAFELSNVPDPTEYET